MTTVYTDHPVTVLDDPPSMPPMSSGSGHATVYSTESVQVVNLSSHPEIHVEPANLGAVLCFTTWFWGGRYTRDESIVEQSSATVTSEFNLLNFGDNGERQPIPAGEYRLYIGEVNPQQIASMMMDGFATLGKFTFQLAGLPTGWQLFRIGTSANVSSLPQWQFVNPGGGSVGPQPFIPSQAGSYDITHSDPYCWVKLPPTYAPTPRPLDPRVATPFSTPLVKDALHCTTVVPARRNVHRPCVSVKGILSTANRQSYHWYDFDNPVPHVPLLDGPRGVGSISAATNMRIDRHGGVILTDSWGVRRVDLTGTSRTRAGFVNEPGFPGYHDAYYLESQFKKAWDTGNFSTAADIMDEQLVRRRIKRVGDWSAVPRHLRSFWDCWGAEFWKKSLALDPDAPPIGGEQPHLIGPQQFVASAGNGTVFRLTYSKDDIVAEPVISVFATGLSRPWDVIEVNDIVYVTEETGNRVSMFDAATGNPLGVFWSLMKPTGIFYFNDLIYVGSLATKNIQTKNIVTGEVKVHCPVSTDGNSNFVKVAVGTDGTFGPAGTVFYQSWSNVSFGFPRAVLPNGQIWQYLASGANDFSPTNGKGGRWRSLGYSSAMAVGMGRMYTSGSQEGLALVTASLSSDPSIDYAKYEAGKVAYLNKGWRFAYGDDGYGYQGIEPPQNEVTPDIEYYLSVARMGQ